MAVTRLGAAEVDTLRTSEQLMAAGIGVTLLVSSCLALFIRFPTAHEWSGDGFLVHSTRSVAHISGIVTTLAIAGLAFIAYALNGIRIVKLGMGSLNLDGVLPEVKSTSKQTMDEVPGTKPETVKRKDVPVQVIADAIEAWPAELGVAPSGIDDFEDASHKSGKGSHPWFLKFKDRPVVRVYYGGRGRTGAHVSIRDPG